MNKFVHDQCCANGYTLHPRLRNSGRKGGGVGVLITSSIKLCTSQVHVNPAISSFESMEFVITVFSVHSSRCNLPNARLKGKRCFFIL